MIALISVLILGLCAYFLIQVYTAESKRLSLFFWPALALKVLGGISLGLIYTYYYSVGDTFGFFSDAQKVTALAHANLFDYFDFLLFGDQAHPLVQDLINVQVRSLFLVKILSATTLWSFNSYWVASFYFSVLSFLGCWYLFTKISLHYEKAVVASAISLFALPSFLFWSSGIIKESIAVAALMFLAGIFLQLIKKQQLKWWEWLMSLIAIFVLWNLKYYWAALFIPAMLTSLIVVRLLPRIPNKLRSTELLIWIIIFTSVVLAASTIHPNFYLSRFLTVIVDNHDAYTALSGDGPSVSFNNLNPTWGSVLTNSPWALLSCLYRPFLFEASTFLQVIVGIENLILLLLTFYNLRYIAQGWRASDRLLIFSLIVYIALLAIFLTLSTPNFGTLSRYRVGFLPFLFFLLLYFPVNKFSGALK